MTENISYYVPADAEGLGKLKREWLIARAVFVVGFVVAIAFAVWFSMSHNPAAELAAADDTYADAGAAGGPAPELDSATGAGSEGVQFCRLTIAAAESYGVTPDKMRYAGGPAKTNIQGRYMCGGMDQANAKYTYVTELVCKNLKSADCVNLVLITKEGGAVLYKRQDQTEALPDAAPAPDAGATAPIDGSDASQQPPATDATGTDGSAPPQ